ncbi:MAG TPA: DegT/DnrJ/EryC1/StrS family aminotransferase [Candidatus Margulisiibacteriota bacterium]|nr:DegT/DnrJ/EryC1/StrS family aminotransferase [Candidatus Margulisiibacteriota bacterium]
MAANSTLLPADPGANYRAHKDEIDAAVHRVLNGGSYILGEQVAAFEEEFAAYVGVRHAVGVASGTDALYLALRACGIGRGDAVATVSHTAVATIAAIELAGATPILVDIDRTSFTIDPVCLERAIESCSGSVHTAAPPRLKAIIPVHLYGHPADMDAIMPLARRFGLRVIEDCAQSHGASIGAQRTGAWGHLAAFSFYPTKNLGGLGDGGAVVTDDPDLDQQLRLLRQYGWRERYVSHLPGLNSRLDELQAAILRVKLRYLDGENARRQGIANIYTSALGGTRIVCPTVRPGMSHVYHQYVVRNPHRDQLRTFLQTQGIATLIHYAVPVHLQPAYEGRVVVPDEGLVVTQQICREILSLPMHPAIHDEQVQHVTAAMVDWARRHEAGS